MGRVPGHLAGFLTCVMSGKAHRDTGLVMPEDWVGVAGGWWLVVRGEGERGADSPNGKCVSPASWFTAMPFMSTM